MRVLLASLCMIAIAHAQEPAHLLTLEKTIPLENVEGRIDHMDADAAGQRLFIAALGNNTVEAVDLKAGKRIKSIAGFAEPQGIAWLPGDILVVANGGDGTCRFLDGRTFKTINSVKVGDDADNVRYDAKAWDVYVGNASGALTVISKWPDIEGATPRKEPWTAIKISAYKLPAHPESFRLETGGPRIFVNIPEADQILVLKREDPAGVTGEVTTPQTWPLKEAKSNFPMCLDETNHRLFAGCRSPAKVLVYDTAASNRLVAALPIPDDTDDLFYDPGNKLLYVSCGAGSIKVFKQLDADTYKEVETIPTAPGARTSLFIPELKMLCVAVPHRGSQAAEIRIFKTP